MNKFLIFLFIASLFACTSIKVKLGGRISVKQQDSLENVMAIRPKFDYLPSKWSPMFKQNMNNVWKKLNIQGINYFAFGKPGLFKKYASRTDPNAKYYQAWFGTYIIKADKQVFQSSNADINKFPEVGIMQYGKLAEYDQMAWLLSRIATSPTKKQNYQSYLESPRPKNGKIK